MRPHTLAILFLAMIGGAGFVASLGGTPSSRPTPVPVALDDVRDGGVEGRLGVPVGTLVTVTGRAVQNSSRAKEDQSGSTFLQIESVDGKPLIIDGVAVDGGIGQEQRSGIVDGAAGGNESVGVGAGEND